MIPAALSSLTDHDTTAEWGVLSYSKDRSDYVLAEQPDHDTAERERDRIRRTVHAFALLMHHDDDGRWTPDTTHGGAA